MSIRCSIDIEVSDMDRLREVLSLRPPVPPPMARPSTEEALARVCYLICKGQHKRDFISAIKTVRELTGLGLKEAKDAVETLDRPVTFGCVE
jgi:ribosomal protein L7/L12